MRRPMTLSAVVLLLATFATPAAADHTDESVVDLTFPVAGPHADLRFGDDFHDSRGGGTRTHEATDIIAPKHRRIHAAMGGVVSFTPYFADASGGPEPSYGWLLSVNGDDGRMYRYLHINNDTPGTDDDSGSLDHAFAPKIADAIRAKGSTLQASDGIRVERGEHVAYVGDSGNATTPHLHFEMFEAFSQDSPRINPYASLRDAEARGDLPGATTADTSGDGSSAGSTDTGAGTDTRDYGPFSDLSADGAHTPAVLSLAADEIVYGCGDGRYCPYDAIERGDLASFLSAALDLTAEHAPDFDDVDADHEHAEAIAAVDEAGILRGFGDDFGPDEPLSRAQLATMLVQGFGLEPVDASPPFGDVDRDGVHTANIAAAYEAGLTRGCADGENFCPWQGVSRGQLASFLDSALASREG